MSKQSVIPRSFQYANVYIDHLLALLTGDEFKVFSFALREIIGWQDRISQRKAPIAISVFVDGKVVGGVRVSRGTGLSITAVSNALSALKRFNILLPVGNQAGPRGQEYWIQDDVDKIDWDGLEERFARRKEVGKQRIARARNARKRSVPQNGSNDQKRSVPQNGSGEKRSVPQKAKRSVPQNGKRSVPQKERNTVETQEKESLKESMFVEKKIYSSSSSSTRACAREGDDDDDDFSFSQNSSFSAVASAYRDWMGDEPTPAIEKRLQSLVETYSAEAVIAAIDAAVEHGGKSVKYVATVLKNGESRKEQSNGNQYAVTDEEREYARRLNEQRRKAVEMSRLRGDGGTTGGGVANPDGVSTAAVL